MEILVRVMSKTERMFEVGEEVVRGWQIEVAAVEVSPAEQELVFGGTRFTTLYAEVAERFKVGEDFTLTAALGPAPVKLALPGRMN